MEEIIKLLLAALVGGLIGYERQHNHGEGLRTIMLVCMGSTLFTMYSELFAWGGGDPRRMAAALVSGVGFLGAGVIMRDRGRVRGLATASSIWMGAALGLGIGIGLYALVAMGTLLVLGTLWGIPRLMLKDRAKARYTYTYQAICLLDVKKYEELTGCFHAANLTVGNRSISKHNDQMHCRWRVHGDSYAHDQVTQRFLKDEAVLEFYGT